MPVRLSRLRRWWRIEVLARWYATGSGVECPVCGWQGRSFLPAGKPTKPNRLCPVCGSLERYRAVQLYLERETVYGRRPIRMLEASPRGPLEFRARSDATVSYLTSDLCPGADVRADLTRLAFASGVFDIVVVLHVLEHIPHDGAVFRELRRVLAPDGIVLLMVPLGGEKTVEDPSASADERRARFGQADHVRLYGMDIASRFAAAGFHVRCIDLASFFEPSVAARHGLGGDDRLLFRLSAAPQP